MPVFKRAEDVTCRDLDDGSLAVLSPTGERMLVLNATASAVWELCDGKRDTCTISTILSEAMSAVDQNVSSDVQSVLNDLHEAGVVEECLQK